jgi:lipoprotein-releasing system permease protein
MTYERFIASRYLRAKQKQSFISLITILSIAGVTVGVMALIVVIAVMAGFEQEWQSRILGVESHLVVRSHQGSFDDYARVREVVKAVEGVEAATPIISDQIMLRSAAGVSGAVVRGVLPESVASVIGILDQDDLARLQASIDSDAAHQAPGIILGKELARNIAVRMGDPVYLIAPRGMLSPIGHVPSMQRFEVAGVFESGLYEYDGSLAYIHLHSAQKLFKIPDGASAVELRLKDIYAADNVAKEISGRLGYPFWTRTWMQMNRNLFSALKLEKTVMFIILVLIILVAAFNIASTLIMMVMEKTRDIAILKAMGATDKSVRRIFVYKGMVIGLIGTLLGVVLGFGLCLILKHYQFIELPGDIYYITTLPVRLKVLDVLLTAAAALGICFLATLYPAQQAARLDPVEAIRYG